jgi:hypothetical protein
MSLHYLTDSCHYRHGLANPKFHLLVFIYVFQFIFMCQSYRLQYFTEGIEWFAVIKYYWNKNWRLSTILTHSYECYIT